jgi:hypothetical protein
MALRAVVAHLDKGGEVVLVVVVVVVGLVVEALLPVVGRAMGENPRVVVEE